MLSTGLLVWPDGTCWDTISSSEHWAQGFEEKFNENKIK